MASTSRNPRVVRSAVLAPRRSMSALGTSVVPCTTSPTWPGGISASNCSPPAAEQHQVGEGASDVHPDANAHGIHSSRSCLKIKYLDGDASYSSGHRGEAGWNG